MYRDHRSADLWSPDSWFDFVLINALTILVLGLFLWGNGCGIGGGNPNNQGGDMTGRASGEPLDSEQSPAATAAAAHFDDPIEEYNASTLDQQSNGVDCGAFTGSNQLSEVTTGRECIRAALAACHPAKYLLNEKEADGDRFVSFVSVVPTSSTACELRVHTVSTDEERLVGDESAACAEVAPDEMLELACGISDAGSLPRTLGSSQ